MYYLIYRSIAANNMQPDGLKELLAYSRDRNIALGITGMLLFFENKFMQLLEGDEKEVKLLYSKICADNRHSQVVTLKEGFAEQRLFPGWSMSFRVVDDLELASEPAYKDVYKPGSPEAADLVSLFNRLRGKAESPH